MSTHHGILLHVVFSTKYRKPVIADSWRDDLFGYIGGTVKEHKASLLKAGGIEDHIHLLLRIHPEFSISRTVQLLKANSSKWVNDNRKTNIAFQWQRGYDAFSVSQSMSETVKTYIARQREHHARQTFQDEYLEILRKHEIEFDLKYVFEREIVA
jgi:putative transposase